MTAEPFPSAAALETIRPHTGWSLGQGIASLAVAVGAVLMVAWNDAGEGAFGVALLAVGVLALAVVEVVRVRSRIQWDRQHDEE